MSAWDDGMTTRVVFLRSKSPAGIEPRLMKEAATLTRAGYDVHAILWDRTLSHPTEETREGIHIHRYAFAAEEGKPGLALRLPRWGWFALRKAVSLRPDVIHAIDFDTAWPAYMTACLTQAKLVYDIFDFYSEMITADLPSPLRRFLARAEQQVIARSDLVILPDLRRERQFQGVHPRRLVEIMNVPEERMVPAELAPNFTVFYGGMIAKDRGLLDLVASCEATGAKLIVAGHGPDESLLIPLIETSPAALYLGTISYEEILRQTAACHAIAALYDPAIPNNRFAAPNKLFEAMMLAKPVIVSEKTAAADVVRKVGCGSVVPYGDRGALKAALERLMLNPAECEVLGSRGRAAFESSYNWTAMEARLLRAYAEL
jgi:glycosyltransferase involved in cell wall biosynthesis